MTFVAYANTGPFTNNVTPPALSATLFNNMESFLDQIVASVVADANITANGSGALTVVSETITGSGTGLTVQHNAVVSGTLTSTGNHIANGGMNTNTIRESGGTVAMDLSAGTGEVKFPVDMKGVIKSIGGGHTLTDWNFGTVSANNGGTTVTHGLKDKNGTAQIPTVLFVTMDNLALNEVAMADNANSSTFRVSTSTSTSRTVWWLALLA
jgi:hypothetical protein